MCVCIHIIIWWCSLTCSDARNYDKVCDTHEFSVTLHQLWQHGMARIQVECLPSSLGGSCWLGAKPLCPLGIQQRNAATWSNRHQQAITQICPKIRVLVSDHDIMTVIVIVMMTTTAGWGPPPKSIPYLLLASLRETHNSQCIELELGWIGYKLEPPRNVLVVGCCCKWKQLGFGEPHRHNWPSCFCTEGLCSWPLPNTMPFRSGVRMKFSDRARMKSTTAVKPGWAEGRKRKT